MSLKKGDKYAQSSSSSCTNTTIALTSTVYGKPNFQSSNGSEIQNVYENSLTTTSKHDMSSSYVAANFVKKSFVSLPSTVTSQTIEKHNFISIKTEPDASSKSNNVDCEKGVTSNAFCGISGSEKQKTFNCIGLNISMSSLRTQKEILVPNSFPIANTNSAVTTSLFPESTTFSSKFRIGNAITQTSPASSSPLVCDTKTTDKLSYESNVTTSVSNTLPYYSFFKFGVASEKPAFAFTNTNSSSLGASNTTSTVTTNCFPTSRQSSLDSIFSTSVYTRPSSEAPRASFSAISSASLPLQTPNATSSSLACAATSTPRYFTLGVPTPVTTSSSSPADSSTAVSVATDTNTFSFRNANLTPFTSTTSFVSGSSSFFSASSYSNQPSTGNVTTTTVTTVVPTSSVLISSNTNPFIIRNASPFNRKARIPHRNRRHRQVVNKISKNSVEVPCTRALGTRDSKCSLNLQPEPSLHNFESLSQDLGKILEEKLIADVHLECNGQTFPAHKTILAARSDFFAEVFKKESAGRRSEKILLSELKPEVLAVFLEYLYTGKVTADLRDSVVCELYTAAHKYKVQCLSKLCSDLMIRRLRGSNCLQWLILADVHHNDELIEAAASFLTKELFTSSDWAKFADEHPRLAIKIYQKYIEKSISTTECHPPLQKFPRKE